MQKPRHPSSLRLRKPKSAWERQKENKRPTRAPRLQPTPPRAPRAVDITHTAASLWNSDHRRQNATHADTSHYNLTTKPTNLNHKATNHLQYATTPARNWSPLLLSPPPPPSHASPAAALQSPKPPPNHRHRRPRTESGDCNRLIYPQNVKQLPITPGKPWEKLQER